MKAAVVHHGGKIKYETVADPAIKESTDAIIKVTSTAILYFQTQGRRLC